MSNVKKQVFLCLASLMLAVLTVLTGIFPVGAVRCYAAEAESTENNFDHTSGRFSGFHYRQRNLSLACFRQH